MKLTDVEIRAFKPAKKRYLRPDSEGLNLAVSPKNLKSWVLRYRLLGKADSMTLGVYGSKPNELTSKEARVARNNAKLLIASGVSPKPYKAELRAPDVFKAIQEKELKDAVEKDETPSKTLNDLYDEFCRFKTTSFGANKPTWQYDTLKKHNERFHNFVLPHLGERQVRDLTEDELTECLLAIQDHGTLVNRNKVRTVFNGLFDYAYGKKYIPRNIAKYISNSPFAKHTPTNFKHVTTPEEFKQIVMQVNDIRATYEVKQALSLALLVFLRPIEVSRLKWEEVDLNLDLITIHSDDMKMGRAHLIPLSEQSKEILSEIQLLTGHTDYVFYSPYGTGKPISRDSLSNALRRNGITEINPHGIRHTASTLLNEMDFDADVIELQLSHVIGGVRGIYNKAQKLENRRLMMQYWSDYVENLSKH